MNPNKLLLPFAALSLAAAPVAAQSASVDRAAAPAESTAELGGSSALVPIIAGLVLVAATFLIAEGMDDDEDDPVSA